MNCSKRSLAAIELTSVHHSTLKKLTAQCDELCCKVPWCSLLSASRCVDTQHGDFYTVDSTSKESRARATFR